MSVSKAIQVIGAINECVNFFQWIRSALSSFSKSNGIRDQKLQDDQVLQLQSDLQCLSDILPVMYNLIDQAEWRSHEHCVAELLPKLKDAVCDAEDLIDELRCYELKVSVEGTAASMQPVIDFFLSVTHGSFNKVNDIQRRLNNLSSQLRKIGLHQATPRFDKLVRPETTSFPTEPKIFGRDEELKELITLLGISVNGIKDPSRRKRTRSYGNDQITITGIPVLPIVGIGGVGKTTLAQNICNHPQVISHFDLRIWTCVSDDFDVKRLTKEAIQSCLGREATTDNLDSLQRILANIVNKKRFLLILDDMWDDALKENGDCWKRFCVPFTDIFQGSMIIVTTRSQGVADLVRTTDSFPLKGLKDDVLWDFFKQCIFGLDSSNIDPELESIGKTILPKLRGSPLAAKTLGRLLGMSHDSLHWNNILMSELWELRQKETDILPALRLSYIYLPFHLKRCFSFCAVYPKDHQFEKVYLAQIWVAEGFVAPQGNTPLLDIGCQYFEDLVNRSFFQMVSSKYVIHDLMHDMAQLVSKDECFILKNLSDLQNVPQNVRHLSILPNSDVKCSDLSCLNKHRKLRTLLCYMSLNNMTSVMDHWFNELRFVRFIFFYSVSDIPKSISNMKHLRYLEISKECHFESLPSEICYLYNLQILYTSNCKSDYFPGGSGKLVNLRRFESMMYQFHQEHAAPVNASSTKGQNKQLSVRGYPGKYLPTWFNPQKLSNLTSLSLRGCNGLKRISVSRNSQHINPNEVPEVLIDNIIANSICSTFSSLIDIVIEKCENLTSFEHFLQPNYMPAIKKIVIEDCRSVELVPTERFGDFLFLEELKVCDCPKIKSHHLLAPSLKKLELENSGSLGGSIECRSLAILRLSHYRLPSIELQKWSIPVLQKLKISNCPYLRFIRESEQISTDVSDSRDRNSIGKFLLLTHLTVEYCEKLETLDDQLLCLPAIESVNISVCCLLSLPTERFGSFPFLKDLTFYSCPRLNWRCRMVLPPSLQKLTLWNCGDFSAWFPRCLENLASLESLVLGSCKGLQSIPSHLWSSNLASLKELRIQSCPGLESIGGQKSIANIQRVLIQSCPNLKELKQPLKRGDWWYV